MRLLLRLIYFSLKIRFQPTLFRPVLERVSLDVGNTRRCLYCWLLTDGRTRAEPSQDFTDH